MLARFYNLRGESPQYQPRDIWVILNRTSFNGVPGGPVGDASLLGEALLVLVAAGGPRIRHPGVVAGVGQGQVPVSVGFPLSSINQQEIRICTSSLSV